MCIWYCNPTHRLVETFRSYGARVSSVSCGHEHTVFLTDDGEVLTCGVGEYGILGTGDTGSVSVPTVVEALENEDVRQIAAGYDHTLALTADGAVFSWGRNNSGQLGHADSFIDIYSMEDFPRKIDISSVGDLRFKCIAAGHSRSAAVTTDGQVFAWGSRLFHAPKLFGRELFDGLRAEKVAIGGDQSSSVVVIITEDGGLWTFGDRNSNMLGNAAASSGISGKQPLPARVVSLQGKVVSDIVAGFGHHMGAFVKIAAAADE
jgi:alpha-tubulin suppressor-like RCC1 family protein